MISREGNQYVLRSRKKPSRVLGRGTLEEMKQRERQVQYFKHLGKRLQKALKCVRLRRISHIAKGLRIAIESRIRGRKVTKLAPATDYGAKAQKIMDKMKRIAEFVNLIERRPHTLRTKAYIRRLGTEISRIRDEILTLKDTKYYSHLRSSMGTLIRGIIDVEKKKAAASN